MMDYSPNFVECLPMTYLCLAVREDRSADKGILHFGFAVHAKLLTPRVMTQPRNGICTLVWGKREREREKKMRRQTSCVVRRYAT